MFLLAFLLGFSAGLWAQESAKPLPEVTEHAEIRYVPLARQARIQGQVHLQITTDGHVVTGVTLKDGHPLLAQAAVENVRAWKFVEHTPGTFDVTFKFHFLDDDRATFLQQPGIVEVVAYPQSGIYQYTLPESWNAQIRNAQGKIDTALTLWIYHTSESEIDGYATGRQGQERELRNSHITEDMLGFDATLDDKYGQRLKFSMIGKMTGDKIRGVFLNYWGMGGTWTAERATKAVSAVRELSSSPPPFAHTSIIAPDVTYHDHVGYPWFANEAGIQGNVQLRVTAQSYEVTQVTVESGNPFLVRAAVANIRTWRFVNPERRTFEVTYSYKLLDSRVEFLKEPAVVDVGATPPPVEPTYSGVLDPDPQEIWQAELTSARENVRACLHKMTRWKVM